MGRVVPVMKAACEEHSHTTLAATSSGWLRRLIGTARTIMVLALLYHSLSRCPIINVSFLLCGLA